MLEVKAEEGEINTYYLEVSPRWKNPTKIEFTSGVLVEGLGDSIDTFRAAGRWASWFDEYLRISCQASYYMSESNKPDNIVVDDNHAGGPEKVKIERDSDYNYICYIGTEFKGTLLDKDGDEWKYSIDFDEDDNRWFVDVDESKKYKTFTEKYNGQDILYINLAEIMRKTSDTVTIKSAEPGSEAVSGTVSTLKTGKNGGRLYYANIGSGNCLNIFFNGDSVLEWTEFQKKYSNYYYVNGNTRPETLQLYTPSEIELKPNTTYSVLYEMGNTNDNYVDALININEWDSLEVLDKPTAITGLTYTGESQELIKAGSTDKNGTMKYAVTTTDAEPDADAYKEALPVATDVGTYYVWYKAASTTEGYDDSAADKVTVEIKKTSLNEATVTLNNSSFTYTGEEQKVTVNKVMLGETELTKDDYEVSGTTAATEVGTYKVTVTGKGNYEGTAAAEWKITSADDNGGDGLTDDQKPSVKSSLKYTGTVVELVNTPTEKLPEGYKIAYVLGDNATDVPAGEWSDSIPTAENVGTYYVWYRITNGDGNDVYRACITATIGKAIPAYTAPTGITAVKGQTLADVKLPAADNGTWKWVDAETTSVGEIGDNKFTATFVPNDTANYEEVKNIEVIISVKDEETPDDPENPDNPDTPETPENPDNPDTPDNPDKPSNEDKRANIDFADVDENIKKVESEDLSSYTDEQTGEKVQVTMKVTSKTSEAVDSETANFIMEMVGETYEGMGVDEVKNEYLDIRITKSVDGGAETEVKDLGRVIEIAVSYDLRGKYNPVIMREHDGEVVKFKRLDSRAANNKEDATFYVDEENQIIYLYAQYFSTYSIAYTTVPSYQIDIDDGNGNVDQIVVANGATIAEPKTPVREGYKFLGWYVGDEKYDFTKLVTGKIKLTAKWEKIIPVQVNILVSKQKVFGANYFTEYGQELSKYKYKFKVDDKSHKKILSATKDMIKAKDTGTAKVALYRKAKGGSWEKIEEHEFTVEKPEVTKKVETLHVDDTVEAMSFVTNKMSVTPTYFLSSKPEVAEVDFNTGKIKVLKKGSTTITIAYDNGIGAAKYKTKIVVK